MLGDAHLLQELKQSTTISNAIISGQGIAQSSTDFSHENSVPSDYRTKNESAEKVTSSPAQPTVPTISNGFQKCGPGSLTIAASAFKKPLFPTPDAVEAADDDALAEDEKWRTDRFLLGTHLYVAINPRALTEMCASGNNCPFHPFCDFAHENSELRERPMTQMWNFKTKLCDKFHSHLACCPYGNRW